MLDARYPYLFTLDSAPGAGPDIRRAMAAFAAEVLNRVGVRVLFDVRRGTLFYTMPNDISTGLNFPPPLTMIRTRGGQWMRAVLDKADEVCRLVRSARVGWAIRDHQELMAKRAYENATLEAQMQTRENRRSEVTDMLRHVASRHGMHTGYRRRLVVDGLKGRG